MNYFTAEWHRGDLTDAEVQQMVAAYWHHIACIAPQLPPAVHRLATAINLHDAQVQQLTFDIPVLQLELRAGDLQMGYSDVALTYRLDGTQQTIVMEPGAEVVYDEVGIADGVFVHRILFSDSSEIELRFLDLLIRIKSVSERRQ